MIKKEVLMSMYASIFDENKQIIIKNEKEIIDFCKILSIITGIQTCNKYGQVYEYIHDIYLSALKILEGEQ